MPYSDIKDWGRNGVDTHLVAQGQAPNQWYKMKEGRLTDGKTGKPAGELRAGDVILKCKLGPPIFSNRTNKPLRCVNGYPVVDGFTCCNAPEPKSAHPDLSGRTSGNPQHDLVGYLPRFRRHFLGEKKKNGPHVASSCLSYHFANSVAKPGFTTYVQMGEDGTGPLCKLALGDVRLEATKARAALYDNDRLGTDVTKDDSAENSDETVSSDDEETDTTDEGEAELEEGAEPEEGPEPLNHASKPKKAKKAVATEGPEPEEGPEPLKRASKPKKVKKDVATKEDVGTKEGPEAPDIDERRNLTAMKAKGKRRVQADPANKRAPNPAATKPGPSGSKGKRTGSSERSIDLDEMSPLPPITPARQNKRAKLGEASSASLPQKVHRGDIADLVYNDIPEKAIKKALMKMARHRNQDDDAAYQQAKEAFVAMFEEAIDSHLV